MNNTYNKIRKRKCMNKMCGEAIRYKKRKLQKMQKKYQYINNYYDIL